MACSALCRTSRNTEFLSTAAIASGWFRKTRIDSPSFKMRSGPGLSRANRFALVQDAFRTGFEQVLHSNLPLLDADQRGIVLVFHGHVEDRAAHRDHRGRRAHAVVIRLPTQLLNMDLHAPQQDIQQVHPGAGILAENDARVGENFESTAVGNLKDRETVWSGYDDLARLH